MELRAVSARPSTDVPEVVRRTRTCSSGGPGVRRGGSTVGRGPGLCECPDPHLRLAAAGSQSIVAEKVELVARLLRRKCLRVLSAGSQWRSLSAIDVRRGVALRVLWVLIPWFRFHPCRSIGFQPLHQMSAARSVWRVPRTGRVAATMWRCLDDFVVLQLFFRAVEEFVQADVRDKRVASMSKKMPCRSLMGESGPVASDVLCGCLRSQRVCAARPVPQCSTQNTVRDIAVSANDDRAMEVLATGLLLFFWCPTGGGHHISVRPRVRWEGTARSALG